MTHKTRALTNTATPKSVTSSASMITEQLVAVVGGYGCLDAVKTTNYDGCGGNCRPPEDVGPRPLNSEMRRRNSRKKKDRRRIE